MGTPSFRGVHNQRKICALLILYRCERLFPGGKGLTACDLQELLGLRSANTYELLGRLNKFRYIGMGLTPPGTRRVRIYQINKKGIDWLLGWEPLVPWERYGWTADTVAEIDKKIKEIVEFRGFQ